MSDLAGPPEAVTPAPPPAHEPRFARVPAGPLPPDGRVRTEGFLLAAHPTTVGQYWHYLTGTGLTRGPEPRLHGFPGTSAGASGTGPTTGLSTSPGGALVLDEGLADLPVTGVTWYGALAYCAWLSRRTGRSCRLPTADEWRYAAAGPRGLRWSLGDEFDRAVYAPPASGPRPVGTGPAGEFGLYDLTGNVFEWCDDGSCDPPAGSRVIKGGAWTVRNPESFENATVFTADELSAVPYIGFRVLAE